jgi:hypothetical protein
MRIPMTKALEVNENSVDGKPAAPPQPPRKGSSGEKLEEHKVQGESPRVNENSVKDGHSAGVNTTIKFKGFRDYGALP